MRSEEALYEGGRYREVTNVEIVEDKKAKAEEKYVVTVEFMYGDADGEGKENVKFLPNQKKELVEFLNFLAIALSSDHNRNSYHKIEGYDKWVNRKNNSDLPTLSWQYDPTCEGEMASIEKVHVTWHDSNGGKHKVKIETTQ